MTSPAKEKIIAALDVPDTASALRLMDELAGEGTWVKIGLQLFVAEGPPIVRAAQERGFRIFLDLKIHDIPNTVESAVASAAALGVDMTTIHLGGSGAMIAAAVRAAGGTLVLGVTVLTSMDAGALAETGIAGSPADQVARLARLGVENGLKGAVCSPHEIRALREMFGAGLTIVTPGVRPAGSSAGDQKRVMTPAQALDAGADYLVIGRPISAAPSPKEAFLRIAEEMNAAR